MTIPAHCFAVGSATDVLASLPDASVDGVYTDPPYSVRTARGARSVYDGRASPGTINPSSALGREGGAIVWSIDDDALVALAEECLRVSRRWVVLHCELEHLGPLRAGIRPSSDGHDRYIRGCAWDRNNTGAPQLTGDRPAQGAEGIAVLHARRAPLRWHGGGKRGIYRHSVARGADRAHPNQKPIDLCEAIVRDFYDPGAIVLDPYCGSGSIPLALANAGCIAWASDQNPEWVEATRLRLAGDPSWFRAVKDRARTLGQDPEQAQIGDAPV